MEIKSLDIFQIKLLSHSCKLNAFHDVDFDGEGKGKKRFGQHNINKYINELKLK